MANCLAQLATERGWFELIDFKRILKPVKAAEIATDTGHAMVDENLSSRWPAHENLGDCHPQEAVDRNPMLHVLSLADQVGVVLALEQRALRAGASLR